MSVVRLSMHKNTKLQRERKELRRQAVVDVKKCVRNEDVAGYCVMSWNKEGAANICWDINEDSIDAKDLPSFAEDLIRLRVTQKRLED